MRKRRIALWIAIALGGSAALGGAVVVRQNRTPPVVNSHYVALGSSFAAGLGLGPRVPGSPIVSQRGTDGYPRQLAKLLKVPSFTDMSSSGSTVEHVLHGGQMLLGPQVDALGPDTRLVTLTAGGNDVGYINDLLAMGYRDAGGVAGAATGLFWKGAKPLDQRPFATLETTLRTTLTEIARRSPQARIVVVTYPRVLPATGTCAALGITEPQAALMRAVGDRLALATLKAAAATGATVVDMAARSIGHDACSAEPWVNGFKPATGTAFHPTLAGARATAAAIAGAIGERP